jgi:hypothetical protein
VVWGDEARGTEGGSDWEAGVGGGRLVIRLWKKMMRLYYRRAQWWLRLRRF